MYKRALLFICLGLTLRAEGWQLGPFERTEGVNPILAPQRDSTFYCPCQGTGVRWESGHIFNPGAVVREGKIYLIYRAEDDYGKGIGGHTSRLGLAESNDGFQFQRMSEPVLFPDQDDQYVYEWPGGCEDPRIIEREEGGYVLTYTQWNRAVAVLAVATSDDLRHWKKRGYAFGENFGRHWSKSGAIVCRRAGERLLAVKVGGKYWMYWGEGSIYAAVSDDLITWEPVLDKEGKLLPILDPRPGKFDSALVEPGPPALMTHAGIVLLYNGKNRDAPEITPGAYSAGQVLLHAFDPTRVVGRTDKPFFKPEMPFETSGQYKDGTVFIQGLVFFKDRWWLYYGAADSVVGVAVSR